MRLNKITLKQESAYIAIQDWIFRSMYPWCKRDYTNIRQLHLCSGRSCSVSLSWTAGIDPLPHLPNQFSEPFGQRAILCHANINWQLYCFAFRQLELRRVGTRDGYWLTACSDKWNILCIFQSNYILRRILWLTGNRGNRVFCDAATSTLISELIACIIYCNYVHHFACDILSFQSPKYWVP